MYVVSISLLRPLVNQYTALGAFTFIVACREDFPFVTDFAALSRRLRILDNLKVACYVIRRAMLLIGTLTVMQSTASLPMATLRNGKHNGSRSIAPRYTSQYVSQVLRKPVAGTLPH